MSSKNQVFHAAVFALFFLYFGIAIAQVNVAQPVNVAIREDRSGACFSKRNRRQLHSEVIKMLGNSVDPQFYGLSSNSCADIYHGHPSGYYWLNVGDQPQQVYCSVNENRCCNGSDGNWMRIAYLNMSDPSQQCPHSWREIESPIRTCRRQFNTPINSVNYSSHGVPYSRVCGRIIAYQYGTPEAFLAYSNPNQNQRTLDDAYVDGISVTYGKLSHDTTFAHLLQQKTLSLIRILHVHAPAPALLTQFHLSSTETTFVSMGLLTLFLSKVLLTVTHYGMATAALVPAPAVNSTTLHGSVSSYQSQLQRILRYG